MTIRPVVCWVECGMFQLVNEGEHGRHDNDWFGGMIKCVHCDLVIVLWLDNCNCDIILRIVQLGVP